MPCNDAKLTGTENIGVSIKTWRADAAVCSRKIFTQSAATAGSASALVMVMTCDAWIAFVARWTAALVAAVYVATNGSFATR